MKKSYLKPESDVWFYLQYMIYLQWIWWEWEKNPEIYTNEKQGKITRLVALPSPVYKIKGRLFSGRKNRKQAGPTLSGTGNPNLQG